jgi:D-lyxose ketol-isomerase
VIINEPEIAASAIKTVSKLWGVEYWIVNTELYAMKFLKVNPGFQCSIHAHALKDETFVGISGTMRLLIHKRNADIAKEHAICAGQSYRVRPQTFHSFIAHNVSWVMEVSTHVDDADVVRLQDSRKLEILK